MQKRWLGPLIPHEIAVIVFLLVAVIYNKAAFDHKVLKQEDVSQWKAMSRDAFQYKETHGHFPLWTEGMFSGMPAYQIAMVSQVFTPLSVVYPLLTLGLNKPANFFSWLVSVFIFCHRYCG